MISPAETNEFYLVVENAKAEGWLEVEDAVTAKPVDSAVIVQCTRAGQVRERTYPHDGRWPYALLRDLAHGVWRASAPPAARQGT